jgi:hypothetical protein
MSVRYAEGTDGVPDTEEFDHRIEMRVCVVPPNKVFGAPLLDRAVVGPGGGHVPKPLPLQQPTGGYQAGEAPRREGTPGEAEEEDLIAGHVILREKHVAGADVVIDAQPHGPFHQSLREHAVEPTPRR